MPYLFYFILATTITSNDHDDDRDNGHDDRTPSSTPTPPTLPSLQPTPSHSTRRNGTAMAAAAAAGRETRHVSGRCFLYYKSLLR
jgi:hypothetical protein